MKTKLLIIAVISAFFASCAIPKAIVIETHRGSYKYSSKGGIEAIIHPEK